MRSIKFSGRFVFCYHNNSGVDRWLPTGKKSSKIPSLMATNLTLIVNTQNHLVKSHKCHVRSKNETVTRMIGSVRRMIGSVRCKNGVVKLQNDTVTRMNGSVRRVNGSVSTGVYSTNCVKQKRNK
ncbi:MAG: hypothetical protein IPJ79_10375 [Bacteroidetes bacterium]|nr:hypothetical protein [Bacteroidota bacterium]